MKILKRKVLLEFGDQYPEARTSLDHWYQLTRAGKWQGPSDVKQVFGITVDFVENNRAVFDIKGNDFRLIVEINYRRQAILIRFLGTHKEYDKVDAGTVKRY